MSDWVPVFCSSVYDLRRRPSLNRTGCSGSGLVAPSSCYIAAAWRNVLLIKKLVRPDLARLASSCCCYSTGGGCSEGQAGGRAGRQAAKSNAATAIPTETGPILSSSEPCVRAGGSRCGGGKRVQKKTVLLRSNVQLEAIRSIHWSFAAASEGRPNRPTKKQCVHACKDFVLSSHAALFCVYSVCTKQKKHVHPFQRHPHKWPNAGPGSLWRSIRQLRNYSVNCVFLHIQ